MHDTRVCQAVRGLYPITLYPLALTSRTRVRPMRTCASGLSAGMQTGRDARACARPICRQEQQAAIHVRVCVGVGV